MQGYILKANRAKDEDLIVTILTKDSLQTLYRFYGARHSSINVGFKIDFEIEKSQRVSIARLKDVIHIGYSWIHRYDLLREWQEFVLLFYDHLRDTSELDSFYFDLLTKASNIWAKQNPKRVAIECYTALLEYEGRLHKEARCFLCGDRIDEEIALVRAFLPTHKACSHTMGISKEPLIRLYETKSALWLSDAEIERMWRVLLEGL